MSKHLQLSLVFLATLLSSVHTFGTVAPPYERFYISLSDKNTADAIELIRQALAGAQFKLDAQASAPEGVVRVWFENSEHTSVYLLGRPCYLSVSIDSSKQKGPLAAQEAKELREVLLSNLSQALGSSPLVPEESGALTKPCSRRAKPHAAEG
jgi:hypothetical protein